jgi:hypothetical protein
MYFEYEAEMCVGSVISQRQNLRLYCNDDLLANLGSSTSVPNTAEPTLTLEIANVGVTQFSQSMTVSSLVVEQFKKNVQALKDQNPEFEHFLYDHEDCRTFLKSYFQPEVLETFEQLVPLAFQSDFWRYCVLYQFGGIYLDVKWTCFPGYKLLDLVDKEHFVLDLAHFNTENGLTPTLIVSRAKNPILLGMIQMIIHNVKNKNKGIETKNGKRCDRTHKD